MYAAPRTKIKNAPIAMPNLAGFFTGSKRAYHGARIWDWLRGTGIGDKNGVTGNYMAMWSPNRTGTYYRAIKT
jgi:hypothetical protein